MLQFLVKYKKNSNVVFPIAKYALRLLNLWTQGEGQLNQGIQKLDVRGGGNIF